MIVCKHIKSFALNKTDLKVLVNDYRLNNRLVLTNGFLT